MQRSLRHFASTGECQKRSQLTKVRERCLQITAKKVIAPWCTNNCLALHQVFSHLT